MLRKTFAFHASYHVTHITIDEKKSIDMPQQQQINND